MAGNQRLPARVSLPSAGVHIWGWRLDQVTVEQDEAWRLLSGAEQLRAGRFHFAHHRLRYVAAHGRMRRLLAAYLQCDPASIAYTEGAHGKPALAGQHGADALQFNLSHSADIALLGVARGVEIGVDVEQVQQAPAGLAAQYFSAQEQAELAALPPAQQDLGFYQCWTRKEAFVKALGTGLTIPLDGFSVALTPGLPAALRWVRGDAAAPAAWRMAHLDPAAGFVGAVAARHPGWTLQVMSLPGPATGQGPASAAVAAGR